MDKLPHEILHKIFVQLDLRQRLRCLLVCRSWWNVLERYGVYFNIKLKQDSNQLNRMLDMFERFPDRAAQVETLSIKTHHGLSRLFIIFPNVRVLRVESSDGARKSKSRPVKELINTTLSISKIKHLCALRYCESIPHLCYSNPGSQLETLCLSFRRLTNTPLILFQLKDLPVLKKLSLESPIITLKHLEEIHGNIPSIQDFSLHSMMLKDSSDVPLCIIPATSITKFSFLYGRFQNTMIHAQFYQYMTKKYINITDTEYIDDELSKFNSDFDDSMQVYLNGGLDFLKLIGPNQTKLDIDGLPDGVNAFESLDAVGSRIKKLNFRKCQGGMIFQYLSQSNQAMYVQEINVLNTGIESLRFVNSMLALTTLRLHFFNYGPQPVRLVDCLVACPPSLKHLTIECASLAVEPFTAKLNSIETLHIHCGKLSSDLGDIISSCFPNLVALSLFGIVTHSMNIKLKNPGLDNAIFSLMVLDSSYFYFSFTSPIYTVPQYYLCSRMEKTPEDFKRLQDLPILSVESLTEKILDVNVHSFNVLPC